MTVTVVSAANSYDLTTVSNVITELGLTDTEAVDNHVLLSRLITRASDTIRSLTNRDFAKEDVEETLFVRRTTPRIILSRTPVVSIDKIELDGDSVEASTYTIEDAERGFVYRVDGDYWDSTITAGGHIVERATRWGEYDWKVTYTAGYDLPSFSNSPNLPMDVERAAIEMVDSWYRARRTDPSIKSERIGEASVTYREGGPGSMPAAAALTIERWQRLD